MRISSEISWCFLFPLVLYSTEANCIWQFPDYAITGDPVFHPVFLMSSTFWATTRCHRSMAGHVGKVLLCDLESQTDCLAFWAVIWHCSTPFAGISAYLQRSFCYIYIYIYESYIIILSCIFWYFWGIQWEGASESRVPSYPWWRFTDAPQSKQRPQRSFKHFRWCWAEPPRWLHSRCRGWPLECGVWCRECLVLPSWERGMDDEVLTPHWHGWWMITYELYIERKPSYNMHM